jgi:hypothetical protein
MSISGVVYPTPPGTTPATTLSTTYGAAAQIAPATPTVPVQQAAPAQPTAPARRHHHHHGDGDTSGQSFHVAQSGTNVVANILTTLA